MAYISLLPNFGREPRHTCRGAWLHRPFHVQSWSRCEAIFARGGFSSKPRPCALHNEHKKLWKILSVLRKCSSRLDFLVPGEFGWTLTLFMSKHNISPWISMIFWLLNSSKIRWTVPFFRLSLKFHVNCVPIPILFRQGLPFAAVFHHVQQGFQKLLVLYPCRFSPDRHELFYLFKLLFIHFHVPIYYISSLLHFHTLMWKDSKRTCFRHALFFKH